MKRNYFFTMLAAVLRAAAVPSVSVWELLCQQTTTCLLYTSLSYTGYPGGQREITPARLQAKPNGDDKLLRKVVKGMLPKNKLGAKLLGNMYVYAGSEHKHDAQNPKMIDINVLK